MNVKLEFDLGISGMEIYASDDETYQAGKEKPAWDSRLTPEQRNKAITFMKIIEYFRKIEWPEDSRKADRVEHIIEAYRDYLIEREELNNELKGYK